MGGQSEKDRRPCKCIWSTEETEELDMEREREDKGWEIHACSAEK